MNTQRKNLSLRVGYIDYNGQFVSQRVGHNEKNGDSQMIARAILSLFRKSETVNTHYPILLEQEAYPEYSKSYIQKEYRNQGVSVEIVKSEKQHLIEDSYIYNHTIQAPFWYLIYLYCLMYGWVKETDIGEFKEKTKNELRKDLVAAQTPVATIRSDAIMMMDLETWAVFDIGS